MHIFISHSSKNADEAAKICELLENNEMKCFIAPRDIRLGKQYAEELVRGIDESDAMVLLMSEEANRSPHVLREVERAVSKSIPILVYKLEEIELSKSMEYFLMAHQWINAKPEEDYQEIIEFVKELREGSESTPKSSTDNKLSANQHNAPKRQQSKILFALCMLLVVALIGLGGYYLAVHYKGQEVREIASDIKVGDTITLGSYNNEPISWRVLRIEEDGEKAVLISKDILTMKAFDAAESGTYNKDDTASYWPRESAADTDMELQAYVRGNSDWSRSNIRTWLNSEKEVVAYEDQAPTASAMSEKKNGYNNEPGFLYGFTEEELGALCEAQITTSGNALSETETVTTTDRIFLLSKEELQWFEDAGISPLAVPTEAAVAQDNTEWYAVDVDAYGVKEYSWWLRDSVENMSSKCYMVGNGFTEDNIRRENVGLEGFGVRPAIVVDLQKVAALINKNKASVNQ